MRPLGILLFSGSAVAALALLGSEPEGLALDFTADDGLGRVAVKHQSTPANNLYNAYIDRFLSNAGTSPKLVRQPSGDYSWAPHNQLVQSEDISTSWTNFQSTEAVDVAIAPDGTMTADRLVADSAGGTGNVILSSPPVTSIGSAFYTYSAYLKADTLSWARLLIVNMGSLSVLAYFDLANAAVGATLGANNFSQGIEPASLTIPGAPAGWYRCWIAFQADASDTTWQTQLYLASANGQVNVNRDGASSVLVWGQQLNRGVTPTPYVRTAASAVYSVPFEYEGGWYGLSEAAGTNSLTNNTAQGAVVGSPGTRPTGWSSLFTTTNNGILTSIDGLGFVGRLRYVDVRFTGTSTTSSGRHYDLGANIATALGEQWTWSVFLAHVAGSIANVSGINLTITEEAAGDTDAGPNVAPSLNSSLQRFSMTETMDTVGMTALRPQLRFTLTNGLTFDFTIRICAPQVERGPVATSPIPTFGSAVTRAADDLFAPLSMIPWSASEGTAYAKFRPYVVGDATHGVLDVGTNGRLIYVNSSASFIRIFDGTGIAATGGSLAAGADHQATSSFGATGGIRVSLNGAADNNTSFDGTMNTSDSNLHVGNLAGSRLGGRIYKVVLVPRQVANADLLNWRYAA